MIKPLINLTNKILLILTDKINLKQLDIYVSLSNLNIYYARKNIKKSYENNKFKISAPTINEVFELPHGSYSISHIQVYFEYILTKQGEKTITSSVRRLL